MAVFNEPTQWSHELGNNADVSTLPDDTSATTGVASLQKLFQIINQTPLEAGGVAPDREDFNALFKLLGGSVFYAMNGGFASYNPAYDYVVGRFVVYNNTLYKCIQANGASSTVVAPDSVSPLGSDYWVQIATLADFANFANTDLSNLSASGQALFDNKADKDFSNVTTPVQAFKDMSISWDRPDLTAGISTALAGTVQSYTCPSDGWVSFDSNGSSGSTENWIAINGVTISSNYTSSSSYNSYINLFIPVKKNDICTFRGGSARASGKFIFYPCLGV